MIGGWLLKIGLVEQTPVSVWILICFSLLASLPGSLSDLKTIGAFDPNAKFAADPKFSGVYNPFPPAPPVSTSKFILGTALTTFGCWWVGEFSGHAVLQSPLTLFLVFLACSALGFFMRKHHEPNSPQKA